MRGVLTRADGVASASRGLWVWLGQLGIVVLGVHLAADRLDDRVYGLLVASSVPWPSPETPTVVATWLALALELVVVARAGAALLLTPHEPALSWSAWKRNVSVDALVLPLFWAPVALAGAWVVGMAAEDALAPYHAGLAKGVAWALALLAAWRLGWTGWKRVVGALDPPKRRIQGWPWAPALLAVGAAAFWHGLPIWGWLR